MVLVCVELIAIDAGWNEICNLPNLSLFPNLSMSPNLTRSPKKIPWVKAAIIIKIHFFGWIVFGTNRPAPIKVFSLIK